jgi:hypothetical protein
MAFPVYPQSCMGLFVDLDKVSVPGEEVGPAVDYRYLSAMTITHVPRV